MESIESHGLMALYIKRPNDFEEAIQFIEESKTRYNLNVITICHADLKVALQEFKNTLHGSRVLYMFMGSRNTDPYSQDTVVKMTDKGWPEFLRVCPLLHWTYSDVWRCILALNLPYCSLYDRGYASLGTKDNSRPNPKLKKADGDGFLPAWTLEDASDERLHRDS